MEGFRPTDLIRPSDVNEALLALKKGPGTSRIVAGNTALYSMSKYGALDGVSTLIDTSLLPLRFISEIREEGSSGIEIGSTTTFSEIAEYPRSLAHRGLEALFETARKITPPQIRNVATMGGALCSGIPFFDMPTAVLALDGRLKIASQAEDREVGVDQHFVSYFETSVANDELLVSVKFKDAKKMAGSAFIKLGRASADFAVVNACSYLELESNGKCSRVRIALGAVSDTPLRWTAFENAILGKVLSPDELNEVSKDSSLVDFEPTSSLNAPSSYKRIVTPFLVRDALIKSLERAVAKKDVEEA